MVRSGHIGTLTCNCVAADVKNINTVSYRVRSCSIEIEGGEELPIVDGSADGWTREICYSGLRYAVRRPDLAIPGGVGVMGLRWDARVRRAQVLGLGWGAVVWGRGKVFRVNPERGSGRAASPP